MQDLDWPFNPQPGLCHFIQSSPGIREKHSTNLRLIVLIHSTFFRERQSIQRFSGKDTQPLSGINAKLKRVTGNKVTFPFNVFQEKTRLLFQLMKKISV